ncbi:hypothetical protein D9758_010387 [Tetrapyrgos nigripes]|uniref:Uncharacterized protein n=1 Tax=Tetrapyrgos nigripes TaxID=182062 RepID=A0A8H5FVZ2_9AGAR|nr:hypothetical protein D9758_010387 [Tetrapyrgos nigripes]
MHLKVPKGKGKAEKDVVHRKEKGTQRTYQEVRGFQVVDNDTKGKTDIPDISVPVPLPTLSKRRQLSIDSVPQYHPKPSLSRSPRSSGRRHIHSPNDWVPTSSSASSSRSPRRQVLQSVDPYSSLCHSSASLDFPSLLSSSSHLFGSEGIQKGAAGSLNGECLPLPQPETFGAAVSGNHLWSSFDTQAQEGSLHIENLITSERPHHNDYKTNDYDDDNDSAHDLFPNPWDHRHHRHHFKFPIPNKRFHHHIHSVSSHASHPSISDSDNFISFSTENSTLTSTSSTSTSTSTSPSPPIPSPSTPSPTSLSSPILSAFFFLTAAASAASVSAAPLPSNPHASIHLHRRRHVHSHRRRYAEEMFVPTSTSGATEPETNSKTKTNSKTETETKLEKNIHTYTSKDEDEGGGLMKSKLGSLKGKGKDKAEAEAAEVLDVVEDEEGFVGSGSAPMAEAELGLSSTSSPRQPGLPSPSPSPSASSTSTSTPSQDKPQLNELDELDVRRTSGVVEHTRFDADTGLTGTERNGKGQVAPSWRDQSRIGTRNSRWWAGDSQMKMKMKMQMGPLGVHSGPSRPNASGAYRIQDCFGYDNDGCNGDVDVAVAFCGDGDGDQDDRSRSRFRHPGPLHPHQDIDIGCMDMDQDPRYHEYDGSNSNSNHGHVNENALENVYPGILGNGNVNRINSVKVSESHGQNGRVSLLEGHRLVGLERRQTFSTSSTSASASLSSETATDSNTTSSRSITPTTTPSPNSTDGATSLSTTSQDTSVSQTTSSDVPTSTSATEDPSTTTSNDSQPASVTTSGDTATTSDSSSSPVPVPSTTMESSTSLSPPSSETSISSLSSETSVSPPTSSQPSSSTLSSTLSPPSPPLPPISISASVSISLPFPPSTSRTSSTTSTSTSTTTSTSTSASTSTSTSSSSSTSTSSSTSSSSSTSTSSSTSSSSSTSTSSSTSSSTSTSTSSTTSKTTSSSRSSSSSSSTSSSTSTTSSSSTTHSSSSSSSTDQSSSSTSTSSTSLRRPSPTPSDIRLTTVLTTSTFTTTTLTTETSMGTTLVIPIGTSTGTSTFATVVPTNITPPEESSSPLSLGAIVGVTVGGAVFLLLAAAFIWWAFCIRPVSRRKRKSSGLWGASGPALSGLGGNGADVVMADLPSGPSPVTGSQLGSGSVRAVVAAAGSIPRGSKPSKNSVGGIAIRRPILGLRQWSSTSTVPRWKPPLSGEDDDDDDVEPQVDYGTGVVATGDAMSSSGHGHPTSSNGHSNVTTSTSSSGHGQAIVYPAHSNLPTRSPTEMSHSSASSHSQKPQYQSMHAYSPTSPTRAREHSMSPTSPTSPVRLRPPAAPLLVGGTGSGSGSGSGSGQSNPSGSSSAGHDLSSGTSHGHGTPGLVYGSTSDMSSSSHDHSYSGHGHSSSAPRVRIVDASSLHSLPSGLISASKSNRKSLSLRNPDPYPLDTPVLDLHGDSYVELSQTDSLPSIPIVDVPQTSLAHQLPSAASYEPIVVPMRPTTSDGQSEGVASSSSSSTDLKESKRNRSFKGLLGRLRGKSVFETSTEDLSAKTPPPSYFIPASTQYPFPLVTNTGSLLNPPLREPLAAAPADFDDTADLGIIGHAIASPSQMSDMVLGGDDVWSRLHATGPQYSPNLMEDVEPVSEGLLNPNLQNADNKGTTGSRLRPRNKFEIGEMGSHSTKVRDKGKSKEKDMGDGQHGLGVLASENESLSVEKTPSISNVSLRDNVDYSRPFAGLVFNRLGSTTTLTSQETRDTRFPGSNAVTPLETPAAMHRHTPSSSSKADSNPGEYPFAR